MGPNSRSIIEFVEEPNLSGWYHLSASPLPMPNPGKQLVQHVRTTHLTLSMTMRRFAIRLAWLLDSVQATLTQRSGRSVSLAGLQRPAYRLCAA